MNPFTKRNLLVAISAILFVGLLYSLSTMVPMLRPRMQRPEFLSISLMIMMSLLVMLFWSAMGVLGGLSSFLFSLIFLYRPLTDLDPYYYSVLIIAFFLSSIIGYYVSKRIGLSTQQYTVKKQKMQEDTNLILNHMETRGAEILAMGEKIGSLFKLKNIADKLSLSLSSDEIVKIVSKETYSLFGKDKRVLLFMFDDIHDKLILSYSEKDDYRSKFTLENGGVFENWTLKNMKSLLVKDVRKDFRFSITGEEITDDAASLIIKPLIIKGTVLGIIRVDSSRESYFGQYELRILDIIGELVVVALGNAQLYCQTEELAIRDSLTGLYVYRYFMDRMEEEVKRGLHSSRSLALLMIDIDNFKEFNDKHGHISGDAILRNIGHILQSKASAGDIAARYGGEEFAFLALGYNREEGIKLADEIREEIQNSPVILRREECYSTVSIGVAVFPEDAKFRKDIIWEADNYLYEAKGKGKNTVCSK